MPDKIEAVVFDMDGVLFDTERLCMEAWREVAAERHIENIEKAVIGCVGLNRTDTRAFFEREYGADFPYEDYHDACTRCFHEKIEVGGLPVKPGARELLHYLKKEGYRIALASSTSRRGVLGHLERAGLTGYFEVIIGGDMVEHSKPLPDIYLMACKALSVAPEKALAIEDSPNGLRSAYAAGMKPVMVPDMIAPTPEIEALLYARCETLFGVKELLMGVQEVIRIPLDKLCNTRDLGGYLTEDGRHIKAHKLIRSGALFGASPEDLTVLCDRYGLRTVIDLRTPAERALKPDPILPGVAYIENPILQEETLGITREKEEQGDGNAVVKKVISMLHSNGNTPLSYMNNMYRNLITNPFSRAGYRNFFDLLLKQEEGAVLWHCTAGKDRVGVGTLLLLSALSVPREQILADYEKVNDFNKREVDILMDALASQGILPSETDEDKRKALWLLFTVDRSYAEAVFEVMEQECGSVDAFLEQEMGLSGEKRRLLKDKYLE